MALDCTKCGGFGYRIVNGRQEPCPKCKAEGWKTFPANPKENG